jgi:hypothetical protein
MSITERLKGTQDMKKLQAELKVAETQKHEIQVQMEPLQDQAMHMITQLEEEKSNMVQAQIECVVMIQEDITMQALEVFTEKVV